MKLLIFNDSQSIEVQAVYVEGEVLKARMIHTTPDELKNLFKDKFNTGKMTFKEDNKEKAVYEGYTVFSYIKEDAGGIYEVEMVQEGKDADTRITEAEMIAHEAKETADGAVVALQEAVAELTTLIAMMGIGGETNV